MPKPPPTSGAWSWMRSSGSLKTNSASWRRMPCSPCPVSSSSIVSRRGIVARDAGARLDRHHDDAVVHHLDLDDVRRLLHRLRHGLGVALGEVEGEIARRLLPDRGRAGGERGHAVDDGGQRLVVDLDQLGCFARDLLAVGHDEGHRIADMAHAALGQRRPRRHDQRLHRRHAGQRAEAVGGEIGCRVDAVHAGQRRAPRNVDPLDERMGVRRAQHVAVQGRPERRCRRRSARGRRGSANPRGGGPSARCAFRSSRFLAHFRPRCHAEQSA